MAKRITASFSDRVDDQKRLREVGGSIMFSKGNRYFPSRQWTHTENGSGLVRKHTKER